MSPVLPSWSSCFFQFYHCLSVLVGLQSSWIWIHRGCKNMLKCLMVAGSHILLDVCLEAFNLPLLEVSPSLLPRCWADSPSLGRTEGLGHKSAWFSLSLLLPGGVCVCPCPSRSVVAGSQSSLLCSCGSSTGSSLAFGGVGPVALSNQSEKSDFSSCCLLSPLNR